jgi:hypothetical protein
MALFGVYSPGLIDVTTSRLNQIGPLSVWSSSHLPCVLTDVTEYDTCPTTTVYRLAGGRFKWLQPTVTMPTSTHTANEAILVLMFILGF